MMLSAAIAAICIAIYTYQDGVHRSQDGDRYTSGARQPSPFNRRFCHWPPRLLMVVTWASFVTLATLLGGWKAALMFAMLPGVWFCAVHPTTVDGPSMLLAWLSAMAVHAGHPALAVGASMLSGCIHERGPVFASLYAWSPWPLLGLGASLLLGLRKAAPANHQSSELADRLVGHGMLASIKAHREHVDMLNDTGLVWSLRGLPLMAAWLGSGPSAWASLAVAFGSRLVGTDTVRFMLWAAPPLCASMYNAPLWMVALHVVTFRRAMR